MTLAPSEIDALGVFKRYRVTHTVHNDACMKKRQRLIDNVLLEFPDLSAFEMALLDTMLDRGVYPRVRYDGEPAEIQRFRDKLGMHHRFCIQMYARNRNCC